MSSAKWVKMFLIIAAAMFLCTLGLNYFVDPFGAFSDPIFKWYSYDMTNNPRVAKISYLEDNFEKYDSYILGCSSTSSFRCGDFGKYTGGKFYNMIVYGADMLDTENFCKYISENYTVKNIIVNCYISNAETYNEESDRLTRNMHYKAGPDSALSYYSRYLFADLRYAFAKIGASFKDTYLQQSFDVFREDNGEYDKRKRDAEPIGDFDEYIKKYPYFADYPYTEHNLDMSDNTVASLKRIKEICDGKNINLLVVTAPVYYEYLRAYDKEQVKDFYKKIAQVTDFWDFAYSSVSFEPRYFYDTTHFRNCVGTMAAARIFGDKSVYVPDDFGSIVTKGNVDEYTERMFDAAPKNDYTASLPVLMYHHIGDGESDSVISPEKFEQQLREIKRAGYETVTLGQISDYVQKGTALPKKPIYLTFDDGYLSNYEIAYPLLKKHNMKGTVFVIGSSVGKDKYKDTDNDIIPHFNLEQAREMQASGFIEIAGHTFDMHQWQPYEKGKARENILKLKGESEEKYISALREDFKKENEIIKSITGKDNYALAYPNGKYDDLSQAVAMEEGIQITFSTETGINTLIKGQPQSLLSLKRYNMNENSDISFLINK